MNISNQEALDILRKWQSEGRIIWALIVYEGRADASFTLFGRITRADHDHLEMDASTMLDDPVGKKTSLKIGLKDSAFMFSDWRELPPEVADWTQKGFEGVLVIAPGGDMTCGLWAFKLFWGESI